MKNITNKKITDYTDSLFKGLNKKFNDLRIYAEENNIPIIQKETESLLISILQMTRPKNVLEIGTAIGYSASVMAEIINDAKIITLERSEFMYDAAIKNIEDLGHDENIDIIFGDAREELEILAQNSSSFDLVFIDAAKSHYMKFWEEIRKMTKSGSIVICDNVLQRGMTVDSVYDTHDKHRTNIKNMREFLEYITSLEDVHTSILAVGDGVSISYIK
ncbi:MAG: O-methyltransferase [Anaerovoracaceae bacterium]